MPAIGAAEMGITPQVPLRGVGVADQLVAYGEQIRVDAVQSIAKPLRPRACSGIFARLASSSPTIDGQTGIDQLITNSTYLVAFGQANKMTVDTLTALVGKTIPVGFYSLLAQDHFTTPVYSKTPFWDQNKAMRRLMKRGGALS